MKTFSFFRTNCLHHKRNLIVTIRKCMYDLPQDLPKQLRKQRTNIENTYSTWLDVIFGVPQGSILVLLLFNVFLADMLFTVNDIDMPSHADDNTPYMIADNVDDLITSTEQASDSFFEWFKNNLLRSHTDECRLLVSTNDRVSVNVDGFKTDKSYTEKLLGVKFDKNLTFDGHISGIC